MYRVPRFASPLILAGLVGVPFGSPHLFETRVPRSRDLPLIQWNDNVRPAGTIEDGVLTLHLEVVRGMWHFLGEDRPGAEVVAFREEGRSPENPGPMIRIPQGTEIRVTVRNALGRTLVVHGLSARKVVSMDSLIVPAGESREVRFVADLEGTYYYWGTTTGVPFHERRYEDSQLTGALIVDPPGTVGPPDDRVMVIGIWFQGPDEDGEPDFASAALVINGRPWPLTERLIYDLGDTVRWRLINATERIHPMHLHGFFFEVESRGDNARDTLYWPGQRRKAVTERLDRGTTATIAWAPDRPGGWIFHCHISYHVVANAAPGQYARWQDRDEDLLRGHQEGNPHRHVLEGMGGLMMGIYIRPPEGWMLDESKRRELRLFIQTDSMPSERRRFGYVLQEGDREPPPDSVPVPGSTIVVWKGEPTSITVVNRTREASQIHWHGLEIESYYDGVAGVGGYPGSITPAILPGASFEMRITPRRPGSYMYHTHVNDIRQQSTGLYAAFIVLDEGEEWDPVHDRVFLLSTNSDPDMSVLLNGTREPEPITLRVGEEYRFRLMNITLFNGLRVRLVKDGYPVQWRAIGKDGADLLPYQQKMAQAEQVVSVGETYDYVYTPDDEGELRVEVRTFMGELLVEQGVSVVE